MVRERNAAQFYESIKSAAKASTAFPVFIFPSAADADSLCAVKIGTQVLASDGIRYSIYPLTNFRDIEDSELLVEQHETLVLLLLNWGAALDLRRLLKVGAISIFVIDSHRPIHLNNLSDSNTQVVVLYTKEDEAEADLVYNFDVASLAIFSDLTTAAESDVEDEDEDESDDECDVEGPRKKRRDGKGDENARRLEEARKEWVRQKRIYYGSGTFHGKPTGCLLFEIAHAIHKNSNELLWMACVSLTDQFVHERITYERYQAGVMELEQYINTSGNLQMVTTITLKDGTNVKAPDFSRIIYEDEPRLMLLGEWTLYDSMFFSSYVATKLKTWTEGGLKRLKLLLAHMGISLVEAQQKFQYMSEDTKKRMKEGLKTFSAGYGLSELYYRSFQRHHGYCSKVSAADVVYGVTAMLESQGEEGKNSADQFWKAYAALSPTNWEDLQLGMQQAIKVQRAIVSQGTLAILKQGYIRSAEEFRWLKLDGGPDTMLLGRPMCLIKFCYFLMDALREQGAGMKPMICAVRYPESSMALIVGVSHRPRLGAQRGNNFGIVFQKVAKDLGINFQHDGFEAAWIRLDAAAVGAFMIQLAEKM